MLGFNFCARALCATISSAKWWLYGCAIMSRLLLVREHLKWMHSLIHQWCTEANEMRGTSVLISPVLIYSCLIPQMCSYLVVNVSFLSWQNLRANKQYLFPWDVRLMSVYYPYADFFTWIWSKFVLLEGKYYCSHFILW